MLFVALVGSYRISREVERMGIEVSSLYKDPSHTVEAAVIYVLQLCVFVFVY